MAMTGLKMLKSAHGAYCIVETFKTPVMYAPQLFHGTSTDVTVPVSSTVRDSIRGARPCSAN